MRDGLHAAGLRLERLVRRRGGSARAGGIPGAEPALRDRSRAGTRDGACASSHVETTAGDRCELCSARLPGEHRHLLAPRQRELRCACRACALLFDHDTLESSARGARGLRLLPDRLWLIGDLALEPEDVARLGIPVGTAFVHDASGAGGPVACYPSPLGIIESRPDVPVWSRIRDSHPALGTLRPDVEGLLMHRRLDFEGYWIASLEIFFGLAGLIRRHWRGMSGGPHVFAELARELDALRDRAVVVVRADFADAERGA